MKTWDGDGNESDWSQPAYWEMGLTDDADWEASWIGARSESEDGALPGTEWSDYSFATDFRLSQLPAAGIVFRAEDERNCYIWQISDRSVTGETPKLRPIVREDGNYDVLDSIPLDDVLGVDVEGVHRVRVELEGDRITTYVDDEQVDSRIDSTFSSGTIGFREGRRERALFDNVVVEGPDGEILFEDDFEHVAVTHFSGGEISDGMLDADGVGVILRSDEFEGNPLLRKTVEFDADVERARAYVSGLGFYELHLNGERIGDRVLDPGKTDYSETVLYSTYDVTEQLQQGTNAIGVALGRGRYGDRFQRIWEKEEMDWWSDPELRLQLYVELADGTTRTVGSDDTWTESGGPTLYDAYTPFNQRYDARREEPGWTEAGFDDSGWVSANSVDGPPGEMESQRVQPIVTHQTIQPDDVSEPEPGTYVFDLGQMIAGRVELTVSGERGTTVTMTEGEKLADDGTVEEITFGGSEFLKQQYTLKGEDTETWEPAFSYGGFRYVQLEDFPGAPTTDSIEAKVIHTAVNEDVESQFSSSNELLDQIHENTRWAMLNNLHSVHTDTPTWEKLGWTETNIEMGESLTYNFSMPRFWTKFLEDCADNQLESGDLHYVVPSPDTYSINIGDRNDPGWDAAYPFVTWLMYEYYGDERVLNEHYENLKRYIEYVESEAEDGVIVRTGLGDYKSPGHQFPPEGPAIASTAVYYRAAEIVADIAELLGEEEDESELRELSEEIQTAFNDDFFDPGTSTYSTGEADEYRQASNVLPLAFDLVPDGQEAAVAENLAENVMETNDGHLDIGSLALPYLLPVLTEHGYEDVAYTIATRTTYPSWGHWIENDVTALLESWELDARSRTHDFKGSVDEWFFQYLAGIREPAEPGFERVVIAPTIPSDLQRASATTETVRGPITSRWERTEPSGSGRSGDGLSLEVTIPGNSTSTVEIPTMGGQKIRLREGGRTIWNNGNRTRPDHPGVESVARDGDRILVEVGAGEYDFALEQLGDQ